MDLLSQPEPDAAFRGGAAPAVELRAVGYAERDRVLLEDLDLVLPQGEAVAILGSNGSGKSLLISLLSTLIQPTAGVMRLFGQDVVAIGETGRRDLRLSLGVVFQNAGLLEGFTVAENLELPLARRHWLSPKDVRGRLEHWLEVLALNELRDAYPSSLSDGQLRRAALARAVITQPRLLLCDEVTTGLDLAAAGLFTSVVKTLKNGAATTIVFVTMNTAEAVALADRLCILDRGKLVFSGHLWQLSQAVGSRPRLRDLFGPEDLSLLSQQS